MKRGPRKKQVDIGVEPPFVIHALEMRSSPAWLALPDESRRLLDRLELEHLKHAGKHNGELVVTYDQFRAAGIRRQSIPEAIRIAEALGFIRVMKRGGRSVAGLKFPSLYRLTYLAYRNRSVDADYQSAFESLSPSHDWRRIASDQAAIDAIETARVTRHDQSQPRQRKPNAKVAERATA